MPVNLNGLLAAKEAEIRRTLGDLRRDVARRFECSKATLAKRYGSHLRKIDECDEKIARFLVEKVRRRPKTKE